MESLRRQRRAAKKKPLSIKFGSLLDVLSSEIRNNRESSPATVESGIHSIKLLRSACPELEDLTPLDVSYEDIKRWNDRLRKNGTGFIAPGAKNGLKGNSSSTINRTLCVLARAIDIAIKSGFVVEIIARLDGLRVKDDAKKGLIPSRRDFGRILDRRVVYCTTPSRRPERGSKKHDP